MKVFALLLLLFLYVCLVVGDDDDHKCDHCHKLDKNLVCGKSNTLLIYATYYNQCACTCDDSVVAHPGECTAEDLYNNQEKPY